MGLTSLNLSSRIRILYISILRLIPIRYVLLGRYLIYIKVSFFSNMQIVFIFKYVNSSKLECECECVWVCVFHHHHFASGYTNRLKCWKARAVRILNGYTCYSALCVKLYLHCVQFDGVVRHYFAYRFVKMYCLNLME